MATQGQACRIVGSAQCTNESVRPSDSRPASFYTAPSNSFNLRTPSRVRSVQRLDKQVDISVRRLTDFAMSHASDITLSTL